MTTISNNRYINSYETEAWRGLRASIPVALGVIPFALVLGARAVQKGISPLEVPLMTGLNFAGGSEFAVVELWTSPPHLALILSVTLLINSRHFLMGATLVPFLRHLPRRRAFFALFFMCDESWAMGLSDAKRRAQAGVLRPFSLSYYMGASLGLYVTWVAFTACGAWIGPLISDLETYGLDMAFPAVFLVLLRGMWKGAREALPWLFSLCAASLCYLYVPGAWYVAVGALVGLCSAYLLDSSS